MQRKEVTFASGADTCASWLYASAGGGSGATVPLIVIVDPGRTATFGSSLGEDSRWRNRASAGWLLSDYSAIRHAETLQCPWLVCVGEADNVALPGPAIVAGRRAPKAVVRTYPSVAHFDIYDGREHEAVVADDLAFLRRHLFPST